MDVNQFPKTLLLTHIPYNYVFGTGVQLTPLVKRYGNRIAWFSSRPPIHEIDKPLPVLLEYQYKEFLSRPTRLRKLRSLFNHTIWSFKLGVDAARMGKKHQVELVWSYLHPPILVAAWTAARFLRVPLAIVIYDDPIALLAQNAADKWTVKFAEHWFSYLIKSADAHAVIGEGMATYYFQQYGIEATVLICGPSTFIEPRPFINDDNIVYIGSIGRLYQRDRTSWDQFVEAVRKLRATHSEMQIKILRIGTLDAEFENHDFIEVTGFVEESELIYQLARIDIGFVSFPFDDASIFSFTSFPSRIMALIQAQRPIVALGPARSTLIEFVERYQCGLTCTSQDSQSLANTFQELIFDHAKFSHYEKNLFSLRELFSEKQYFAAFESFIGKAMSG